MKKIMPVLCVFLLCAFLPSFAWADTILGTSHRLANSDPTTEEAWLEGLFKYSGPAFNFISKIEDLWGGFKQFTHYDPGFTWDYAVVTDGQDWTAYGDSDHNHLLDTGQFHHGISDVSFFDQPQSVPEPTTIVLLGFGLISLWGLGRKFRK